MNSSRTTATIVGVLFIIATVTYAVGNGLIESGYIWGGIALELVNSIAVVSIAILFVPILKPYSLPIAYGYLATRIAEAVILTVGAFVPLVSLTMSGYYTAFQLAMLVLGVGSLFFCYLLYQTRLIPRPLSILGLVGYGAIAVYGFTELLGSSIGMILFVPGGIFEILFPLWLIVKGFNPSAIDSASAQTV